MSDELSRRELLGRLGAGASVAALAGCPGGDGTETPTRTRPEDTPTGTVSGEQSSPDPREEEIIDLQEAGASPDGDESILPVLESVPTEDVVLQFPPGEYFMDDIWRVESFENLTIEGPRATIRPTTDLHGPLFGMWSKDGSTGLTITGLTFDVRGTDRGPRPIYGVVDDGLLVEDVDVLGRMGLDQDGMRFDVAHPEGSGVVRGLSMPHGATTDHRVTGVYVGKSHRGHLTFESCHVAGFPDNGLYASQGRGRVDVVGGSYVNNGISNVRVSGPSTVRNVTVRCDRSDRNLPNMRGIRLREGQNVLVRNCEIEMTAVTGSDGAITCAPWLEEATIRDISITIATDSVAALWAKRPADGYAPDRDHPLRLENIQVTGNAGYGSTVTIAGRENPLMDSISICQPGIGRNGLRLVDAGRTILRESQVAVAGDPLIFTRAEISRDESILRQIEGGESC